MTILLIWSLFGSRSGFGPFGSLGIRQYPFLSTIR